jgi:hypothetical protein
MAVHTILTSVLRASTKNRGEGEGKETRGKPHHRQVVFGKGTLAEALGALYVLAVMAT